MNRTKAFLTAVALMLIATAAYAQGSMSVLQGTVSDVNGKPFPDVTLIIKNTESSQSFTVKTDTRGH